MIKTESNLTNCAKSRTTDLNDNENQSQLHCGNGNQSHLQEQTPRPPVQADEKMNCTQSPTRGGNGRGRPKGSKNRTTLLNEAIRNDFTRLAKMRSRKIFEKLTEEAMKGEPWAVKLFMDKLLPNADSGDGMLKGGVTVEINISDMKPDLRVINGNDS